uniref:Uncharacterized protein n=1 Tax=Moniliophthora roreri TaxID=221103 RepID=A0A0W0FMY7_MONRR
MNLSAVLLQAILLPIALLSPLSLGPDA